MICLYKINADLFTVQHRYKFNKPALPSPQSFWWILNWWLKPMLILSEKLPLYTYSLQPFFPLLISLGPELGVGLGYGLGFDFGFRSGFRARGCFGYSLVHFRQNGYTTRPNSHTPNCFFSSSRSADFTWRGNKNLVIICFFFFFFFIVNEALGGKRIMLELKRAY